MQHHHKNQSQSLVGRINFLNYLVAMITFAFLKRVLSAIVKLRKFLMSLIKQFSNVYLCCVEFFKVCSQALALSECCRRFFVSAGRQRPALAKAASASRCRGAKSFHVLHGVRGQALQSPICAANKSRLPSGAATAATSRVRLDNYSDSNVAGKAQIYLPCFSSSRSLTSSSSDTSTSSSSNLFLGSQVILFSFLRRRRALANQVLTFN